MSTLWLVLTPLLATWLPAGWLAARTWNALGIGCDHLSDSSRQTCPRNHDKEWDWERAFKSDIGPAYFGFGVMLGWILVSLLVYLVVVTIVVTPMYAFLKALGRRLAPRQVR